MTPEYQLNQEQRHSCFNHCAFADALSPILSIISEKLHINLFLTYFENFEFSERNPYPGCIASAFVISAAAITFSNRTSCLRRPYANSFISKSHMQAFYISSRINSHGLNIHLYKYELREVRFLPICNYFFKHLF
jgi:hypothetical protein